LRGACVLTAPPLLLRYLCAARSMRRWCYASPSASAIPAPRRYWRGRRAVQYTYTPRGGSEGFAQCAQECAVVWRATGGGVCKKPMAGVAFASFAGCMFALFLPPAASPPPGPLPCRHHMSLRRLARNGPRRRYPGVSEQSRCAEFIRVALRRMVSPPYAVG